MAQLDQMHFSSSQFCSAGLKARINKQPEAVQEVVQNNVMLIYAPPHIDSFPIAFFFSRFKKASEENDKVEERQWLSLGLACGL